MNCPKCKNKIDKDDINIHTDIAKCGECNFVFNISELLVEDWDDDFDIFDNPEGTWIRRENNKIIMNLYTHSIFGYAFALFVFIFTTAFVFIVANI